MSCLHGFTSNTSLSADNLKENEKFSIYYHDLFDYPLNFSELLDWRPNISLPKKDIQVACEKGYFFIKGRRGIVYKRELRERISKRKIDYAKKAAEVMKMFPSVKMVGLTGSLSMNNAKEGSDIDLLVITKKGRLWSTRMFVYLALKIMNFSIRKPNQGYQKDKLCLNIWMDESDLAWNLKDRNIYTAHEILQTVPLVEKDNIYKKFLKANKWVLKYWQNNKKGSWIMIKFKDTKLNKLNVFENFIYRLQYSYMKNKITLEIITPTRAIFHPRNLSKEVLRKIAS